MSEMSSMMDMPLPENTLPMMTGNGQYGAIDMGGMFTTIKIREGLGRNDYHDPGPYNHPKGSVAKEVANDLPPVSRVISSGSEAGLEVKVRKPMDHIGH